MAIKRYMLVITVSGLPVMENGVPKRAEFEQGQQPSLASAKGLRWLLDEPPSHDPQRERPVITTPISSGATAVPYTVETDPAHAESVSRKNAEAMSIRRVEELRQKGDLESRVEALEILVKKGLSL